eukprot:tig00000492_g1485.t1
MDWLSDPRLDARWRDRLQRVRLRLTRQGVALYTDIHDSPELGPAAWHLAGHPDASARWYEVARHRRGSGVFCGAPATAAAPVLADPAAALPCRFGTYRAAEALSAAAHREGLLADWSGAHRECVVLTLPDPS